MLTRDDAEAIEDAITKAIQAAIAHMVAAGGEGSQRLIVEAARGAAKVALAKVTKKE